MGFVPALTVAPHPSDTLVIAQMAMTDGAGNRVEVRTEQISGERRNHITFTKDSVVTLDIDLGLTTGSFSLFRILRAGTLAVVFIGGQEVLRRAWTSAIADLEVRVLNSATTGSRVVSRLTRFQRRPVVVFDDVPATDVRDLAGGRYALTTPDVGCRPGDADIRVTACLGPVTIEDGITFVLNPSLVSFKDAGSRLIVCNDPVVTRRQI